MDGASNTIAVSEILLTDIYRTEPRDLDAGAMSFQLNAPAQSNISSAHPGGVTVLFADGHAQNLSDATSSDVLRALLTIDGSEVVSLPRP